jgi:hypothetical protein
MGGTPNGGCRLLAGCCCPTCQIMQFYRSIKAAERLGIMQRIGAPQAETEMAR